MKTIKLLGLLLAIGLLFVNVNAQRKSISLVADNKETFLMKHIQADSFLFANQMFQFQPVSLLQSPRIRSNYGSLAIDGNQGSSYGFAYNYSSSEDADEKALSECGDDCEVVHRFSDGCAAYAADQTSGSSVYGWGEANSGGYAQSAAIRECQSRGGRRCVVRSWGCNSD